ncbi:MAG: multiprotein-bridging factor 1 family protein [Candidatus Izemoplasmatales bacterium]
MDYGKLIKDLREVLIISQTELADMLGVSFSTVNRWENGRHEPTLKLKRRLINLFNQYNITKKRNEDDISLEIINRIEGNKK